VAAEMLKLKKNYTEIMLSWILSEFFGG